ncbi:metallophosphoesterase family protein [Pseudoclavibacter sp. VKM Ac-2867]|uniref:metallophosphoesterase family protein n=1 Tax=Pseudoclavibacter sp. VKM Ac-2867 TaxID=2783829 RepID=UPI00188C6BE0|nr:metallophosphoesterase [Pseudoclavibacter sp. VKM Ac-2867]MBF4457782.1 metallophosphoesterase [Pseudoclavibacter sp. VKM Ac-2867]
MSTATNVNAEANAGAATNVNAETSAGTGAEAIGAAQNRTTVLHLSDVHATVGAPLYGAVDGIRRMHAASDYARAAGITPEVIVISGDLIERRNEGAYPALREALLELEAAWGVPVLTVLGNHDDRDAARILPGHAMPDGAVTDGAVTHGHLPGGAVPDAATPETAVPQAVPQIAVPQTAVPRAVRVGEWRFVLLDSSPGHLGAEQLAWLDAELAQPFGSGSIVVMHHPPLGSPLPMLARAGLGDAADFLDIVEGTDVRMILSGHFHHPLAATMRGVHVSVGPALAYHQVMDAEPGTVSGFDRSMFSLVHLTPDGVSASSVAVEHPSPLFTLSPSPADPLSPRTVRSS